MIGGGRRPASRRLAAVKPDGGIMHIGLLDWRSAIGPRKLTLAEISLPANCACTIADLRATAAAIEPGVFGNLAGAE